MHNWHDILDNYIIHSTAYAIAHHWLWAINQRIDSLENGLIVYSNVRRQCQIFLGLVRVGVDFAGLLDGVEHSLAESGRIHFIDLMRKREK
jgi:hypothetical protein